MLENTQILKVEDRSHIKSVTFTFPELMASNAEEQIKTDYANLLALKEQLYSKRDEVRALEKQVKALEDDFKAKSQFFTLEFESGEKEVHTYKSNVVFKGLVYGNGNK